MGPARSQIKQETKVSSWPAGYDVRSHWVADEENNLASQLKQVLPVSVHSTVQDGP